MIHRYFSADMKNLFRGSAIYAVVNVFYKATPLIILPLVARKLPVEDVGLIGIFTAILTILIPVIACGTHGYVSVQFTKRSQAEMARLVAALFLITILASLVLLVIGFMLAGAWYVLLGLSEKQTALLLTAALSSSCLEILLVIYQMRQQPHVYAVVRMLMMIFEVGAVIILVLVLDYGLSGALFALTFPPLLALCALLLIKGSALLSLSLRKTDIIEALWFGFPVLGYQLGFLLVVTIDRLMVASMLGLREAGVFLIGVQLGMAIALLNGAINKAWVPWLFPKLAKISDADRTSIVRIEYFYFLFLLLVAGGWSIVGSILLRLLFPEEFLAAESVIWVTAFAHAFAGMYKAKSAYLFFTENTKLLFILAVFIAIINVLQNMILIPAIGILGAAIATLSSYIISFILVWWLGHRVYPMPFRVRLLG